MLAAPTENLRTSQSGQLETRPPATPVTIMTSTSTTTTTCQSSY